MLFVSNTWHIVKSLSTCVSVCVLCDGIAYFLYTAAHENIPLATVNQKVLFSVAMHVWRHVKSLVRSMTTTLLHTYCWISRWTCFESFSAFGEGTDKSIQWHLSDSQLPGFWGHHVYDVRDKRLCRTAVIEVVTRTLNSLVRCVTRVGLHCRVSLYFADRTISNSINVDDFSCREVLMAAWFCGLQVD